VPAESDHIGVKGRGVLLLRGRAVGSLGSAPSAPRMVRMWRMLAAHAPARPAAAAGRETGSSAPRQGGGGGARRRRGELRRRRGRARRGREGDAAVRRPSRCCRSRVTARATEGTCSDPVKERRPTRGQHGPPAACPVGVTLLDRGKGRM